MTTFARLLTTLTFALALALGGCGGGDDGGGSGGGGEQQDAAAVYENAVKELDSLQSGKIDAHVDTTLKFGEEQQVNVAEKATFAGRGGTALPRFAIEIDVEQSDGEPQHVELVNTGDNVYVKQDGEDAFTKQGANAVEALQRTYKREQQALEEGRLPLLALTPSDWAKSPRIEGTETVDGVQARRIVADLDVPAFLRDLEDAHDNDIGMGVTLGQNARRLLEPGADLDTARLVALVGEDDGRLRRLSADVDGNVGGEVTIDFDADLSELGEPQDITAP